MLLEFGSAKSRAEAGMSDDWHVGPDDVRALIDEIGVDPVDDDREWNAQIWIPEYAEPVLGRDIFESLEARLGAIPGIERLAWEDREVFLARVAKGTSIEDVQRLAVDAVRGAIRDAGHDVP
jgi:hypothetical protein